MPLQMPYQFRPYPLSPDEDPEDPNQVQIPNQPPPQAPLPPPPQIQPSPPQPSPDVMIPRTPGPPAPPPGYPGAQPLPNLPYSEDRAAQAVQEAPPNLPGPPTGMRSQLPPGIQGPGAGIPPPQVAPPQMSPEMQQYQTVMGQMPQRPKPSWLDRIVAMAAGGAQGYLAGSPARATREAAAGFQGIPQQILEGDYPERMREWQTRMGAAAQAAGMAQKAQDARDLSELRQSQAGYFRDRNVTQENVAATRANTSAANLKVRGQQKLDEIQARATSRLAPVSEDKAKELQDAGYMPTAMDDDGNPLYDRDIVAMHEKGKSQEAYRALKENLGKWNIESREKLAAAAQAFAAQQKDKTLAAAWDRQSRQIAAADARANASTGSARAQLKAQSEYLKTTLNIDYRYRNELAKLDKDFKINDPIYGKDPAKLNPNDQLDYWSRKLKIESDLRQSKDLALELKNHAMGWPAPKPQSELAGEIEAQSHLDRLRGKPQAPAPGQAQLQAQGIQPSGETKLQGLMGGQAYIGKPAPTNRKFPAGISWDPATGWYVQAGSGAQYGWDGEKLVKVAGGTGARPSGR